MKIVICEKCHTKNRVRGHADNQRPVCGKCGAVLKGNFLSSVILISLTAVIVFVIVKTPDLIGKDFSNLITDEARKTEILKEEHEYEFTTKESSLKEELSATDPKDLQRRASKHYKTLFESRKSYDAEFALTDREKAQLRMRELSSDTTKSLYEKIKLLAKEASPKDAVIKTKESMSGIILDIEFDMSSMTTGELGTRTKHRTKDSLRKETISLISRVTNDVFVFSKGLNIGSIIIGCRHYTIIIDKYGNPIKDEYGSIKEENTLLYKMSIEKSKIQLLSNNPFLKSFSTSKDLKVEEDNFKSITITTERTRI